MLENVIGLKTRRVYTCADIDDPLLRGQMDSEPLLGADGQHYRPVRAAIVGDFVRQSHLRIVNVHNARQSPSEISDTTHAVEILKIYSALMDLPLTIIGIGVDGNPSPCPLFDQCSTVNYVWTTEGACRIEVARSWIEPDIGGRPDTTDKGEPVIFPSREYPAVLVEVVDTHPPDLKTLKRLLRITRQNTVVAFHFCASSVGSAPASYLDVSTDRVRLATAIYIDNGHLYYLGRRVIQHRGESFEAWYHRVRRHVFGQPPRLLQLNGQAA